VKSTCFRLEACGFHLGLSIGGADLTRAKLEGADLSGADLHDVILIGATYNGGTLWPKGFNWEKAGAVFAKTKF